MIESTIRLAYRHQANEGDPGAWLEFATCDDGDAFVTLAREDDCEDDERVLLVPQSVLVAFLREVLEVCDG